MPGQEVFEYACIRLVPKVEREEFLNVGVILFSKKKKFLDMCYILDPLRLKAFSQEIDLEEVEQYLQAWNLISQGHPDGGRIAQLVQAERFRWLTATKSTIIQCSKVHPGLCTDPAEVLQQLFEKYVA